jgi:hypothetical protein
MSFNAQAEGAHSVAPSSILMGGEGDKESALLAGRRIREPLRLRLDTTLGGRYEVGGTVGEFRGDAFKGMGRSGGMNGSQISAYSRGDGQPRLRILPHGRSAEPLRIEPAQRMYAGMGGGSPANRESPRNGTVVCDPPPTQ